MHEVRLSRRAEQEMDDAHQWWAQHRSVEQADRWYVKFHEAMSALAIAPDRCSLASENESFPIEVRQLTFGLGARPTHRALYTVRPDAIVILRIRHVAQAPVSPDDD